MFCLQENTRQLKRVIDQIDRILVNLSCFPECTTVISEQVGFLFKMIGETSLLILTDSCHHTVNYHHSGLKPCDDVTGYGLKGFRGGKHLVVSHRIITTDDCRPLTCLLDPKVAKVQDFYQPVCRLRRYYADILLSNFDQEFGKPECAESPDACLVD